MRSNALSAVSNCRICRKLQAEAQSVGNQSTVHRQQAAVDLGVSPTSSFAGHMRAGRPPPAPQPSSSHMRAPLALLPPVNGRISQQHPQKQLPQRGRQQQNLLGTAHMGSGAGHPAGAPHDITCSPSELNMTELSAGGASELVGSAAGQERGKQSMRAAREHAGELGGAPQHKSGASECSRGSRGSRGSLADLLKAKYTQR